MEIGIAIGLDAVSFMLSLLLVTMGLVIIFGLMNVINMAHGEFFLIGAYIVVTMQQVGQSFWLALIIAPMVLAVIGIIVEELVIRHVYHRFIDTILATWGISLILKQAVIIIFGPTSQSVVNPIPGTVDLVGVTYPAYRLAIMGISVLLATGTLLFIYRTNIGLAVRGVIANRMMTSSLGINTRQMDRATFAFGAALAGFAGAVMAPIMSVDPQMGVGFLVPAFLSILVGGTTSLLGALLGSGIIGTANTVMSSLWTQVAAQITVFSLAILLIRIFPQGLTGRKGRS